MSRYTAWGSAMERSSSCCWFSGPSLHVATEQPSPILTCSHILRQPVYESNRILLLSAFRRPPRSPRYELRLSHQNDGWHGGLDYLLAQHVVPYVHFPIPLLFDDEFLLGAPDLKTWHVPQSSWGVVLAAWPANVPYSVLFFWSPGACWQL